MPNIQFDIFYDNDVFNFTASRSQGVPKVKPEWKVRTAPKLPPKEKPAIEQAAKPTKPTPKAIPKPTVQLKSSPVEPKKPVPTVKVPKKLNTPKPNGIADGVTNGAKSAAPKA